ncbi:hypothetical protein XFEB_00906 [Xylella fastidiosa EB92.1]|nr:hypothetical protein XFEB_00906 [Xylella fastidiosa EB92.1]
MVMRNESVSRSNTPPSTTLTEAAHTHSARTIRLRHTAVTHVDMSHLPPLMHQTMLASYDAICDNVAQLSTEAPRDLEVRCNIQLLSHNIHCSNACRNS